jgi:hypothetical protein
MAVVHMSEAEVVIGIAAVLEQPVQPVGRLISETVADLKAMGSKATLQI